MSDSVLKFDKTLYSKIALIKAAYNFTDRAYIHLDADDKYFFVTCEAKREEDIICEKEFLNELLAQSVRHEVYSQTKDIRELLLARAMATSVVYNDEVIEDENISENEPQYGIEDIIKDWFENDESAKPE